MSSFNFFAKLNGVVKEAVQEVKMLIFTSPFNFTKKLNGHFC